ncbi:hypothetical protein [Edwardsiella piscicida]|uniref:hypothetical protein n=1 Tax=Edwardsiella piscicida TaxID=1263550 RepID=UPI00370D6465
MTTPPNIDIFNETVGKTLAFLYENFPRRTSFSVSELTDIPEPLFDEEKQSRIAKHRALELRFYSIAWLVDAGYISAKPVPYNEFHDAISTVTGDGTSPFITELMNGRSQLSASLSLVQKAVP